MTLYMELFGKLFWGCCKHLSQFTDGLPGSNMTYDTNWSCGGTTFPVQ